MPVLPPLLGSRGTHARARSHVGFGRYTAVIRTCERARRWDVALALMDEMASAGYNFYGASRLWHDRMVGLSEPLRVTVARCDDTSPLAARQDGLSRSTTESNRRVVRRDIPILDRLFKQGVRVWSRIGAPPAAAASDAASDADAQDAE